MKKVKNEGIISGFVVGGQPDAEDIASGRFTSIINCRPPEEEGNVTAELVRDTEIIYTNVPYTADTLAPEHIAQMRAAIERSNGTTLVHCNGGTRAAVGLACALAERAGQGAKEAVAAIEAGGFDVKGRSYEKFIADYFAER